MSGEVRLTHRSGAVVTAGLQADGHWIVTAADAQGVAFALGVPPHFQHAEHSGAALLLVGEYAGTHYSLAITATIDGFQFDFAERWNDRAANAGKELKLTLGEWRIGAAIAVDRDGDAPYRVADRTIEFMHDPKLRRTEYRLEFRTGDAPPAAPFRRIMQQAEAALHWSAAAERWRIGNHHWQPEGDDGATMAFDAEAFAAALPSAAMQALLAERGVERVFEFRDFGLSSEIDLALFDPRYSDGGERLLTAIGDPDWIVYASHFDMIVVGGWLAEAVKNAWPNWADGVFRPRSG